MVMVVDDRLTPSTVLVFLFYDGGAVGRLSLFNYGRNRGVCPQLRGVPDVGSEAASGCLAASPSPDFDVY